MDEKACTQCKQILALDHFHINKKGKFGRQAKCKPCTNLSYYGKRKEKLIQFTKERRSTEEGRKQEREWQRNRRRANPIVRMLQEAKVRANKKGMEFSIGIGDLSIPDVCPALGIPILMSTGSQSGNSPSIDRVDSSKGYVKGNVRIISWRANRLKNDATLAELKLIVQYCEHTLGVAITFAHHNPKA